MSFVFGYILGAFTALLLCALLTSSNDRRDRPDRD